VPGLVQICVMVAVPAEVSDVASAPPTPPSRREACGVEGASPSKRRRARAAVSKGRLWLRTRWETLAAEEDEENRVDFREEVDKLVQVKFDLLAEGLVLGVADTLKAVIAAAGLLTTEDMNGVRDEIRQQFQLDIGRLDSRVDNMAGLANVRKEGLRKKVDMLYGRVAEIRGLVQEYQENERDFTQYSSQKFTVAADDDEFTRPERVVGAVVELQGLVARPELNGTRGELKAFCVDKRRWQVMLPGGETVLLKEDNLTLPM